MSTDKLPFGLIFEKTTVILLLLIHRLLLLSYVSSYVINSGTTECGLGCFGGYSRYRAMVRSYECHPH